METPEEKVQRVIREKVDIVPYDPNWPQVFIEEKEHLFSCLPRELIRRIEHFGSTAVPGLAAKPIVDISVEVTDLEETRLRIAPLIRSCVEPQAPGFFRPEWLSRGPGNI